MKKPCKNHFIPLYITALVSLVQHIQRKPRLLPGFSHYAATLIPFEDVESVDQPPHSVLICHPCLQSEEAGPLQRLLPRKFDVGLQMRHSLVQHEEHHSQQLTETARQHYLNFATKKWYSTRCTEGDHEGLPLNLI